MLQVASDDPQKWGDNKEVKRLTIAARDNGQPDPRFPSDASDFQTVYFSIKGSDLAEFHEGRLTLEQARKLVTIRED